MSGKNAALRSKALPELYRLGSRLVPLTSKGHDLFATIHGRVSVDNDRAVIDRLWTRYVAAWFEGGKDVENGLSQIFRLS